MTTRTWAGGSGLWTDPTQWLGGVAPLPGDAEVVGAGTVSIPAGGSLDAAAVLLGSSQPGAPATFAASGTAFGSNFTIDSTGLAAYTAFVTDGGVGDFGTIDAAAAGGTFTITTNAQNTSPGELVLLGFGQLEVSGDDTVVLDGTIANHATITVGDEGTFVNNGTVAQAGAAFEVELGGTLTGSGVFRIGLYRLALFPVGLRAERAGGKLHRCRRPAAARRSRELHRRDQQLPAGRPDRPDHDDRQRRHLRCHDRYPHGHRRRRRRRHAGR